jgi:hypothetical protein
MKVTGPHGDDGAAPPADGGAAAPAVRSRSAQQQQEGVALMPMGSGNSATTAVTRAYGAGGSPSANVGPKPDAWQPAAAISRDGATPNGAAALNGNGAANAGIGMNGAAAIAGAGAVAAGAAAVAAGQGSQPVSPVAAPAPIITSVGAAVGSPSGHSAYSQQYDMPAPFVDGSSFPSTPSTSVTQAAAQVG